MKRLELIILLLIIILSACVSQRECNQEIVIIETADFVYTEPVSLNRYDAIFQEADSVFNTIYK